ncbi:hypothetical protein [Flindersiella endophytica]
MSQEEFDRDHRSTLWRGRDRLVDAFRSDRNITGVGVGYRYRGGEPTDEPVVIAAVAKKRPEAHVARTRMLPQHLDIDGTRYGVDIIEAGPFRTGPTAATADGEPMVRDDTNTFWRPLEPIYQRIRPALQGCTIANEANVGSGTFGCLVRDRTDGTLCLLSNNHVLANLNQAFPGRLILQPRTFEPDPANGIANLKRYIPLRFDPANPGNVDCAIAEVIDPTLVSKNVALGLMPPISRQHPAVGLLFAGDTAANILICDMGEVLRQLNVTLLADEAVRRAELGMHVDKVGSATRYTATEVIGLDFTIPVSHGFPGVPDPMWISGAHLVANGGWFGDSGSVVCAGGNNDRPVYVLAGPCFVIPIIPDMYDLPDTATTAFADRIRDEFLALTLVGRLLIQVLYLNSETVISRTEGVEASDDEKFYANDLYAKYRDFMEAALDDPDDPRFVVTQEHLDDTSLALYGFSLRATEEESQAAGQLYDQVLTRTVGMNYRQLLAFMNDISVYNEVYDILATIPGLVMRDRDTTF